MERKLGLTIRFFAVVVVVGGGAAVEVDATGRSMGGGRRGRVGELVEVGLDEEAAAGAGGRFATEF